MGPEGARRAGALAAGVVAALAAAAAGCARDPAMVGWEAQWLHAERALVRGDYEEAARRFERLERRSLTPVDQVQMKAQRARALAGAGRPTEAIRLYGEAAQDAVHLEQRARYHYDLARLTESLGLDNKAVDLYRRVVVHYPDTMPGVRALAHLERIFRARGVAGLEAHFAWGLEAYPLLRGTELGDNLVYGPAHEAYQRFKATGQGRWAEVAERLYQRVARDHPLAATWDDAMWELSHLYHRLGRFEDELAIIRRIQATREVATFIGNYEHTYYWVGQLRAARVLLLDLGRPRDAVAAYQWFLDNYPMSRWRDDTLFWQGCALLRAGDAGAAEAAFEAIPRVYEDSKYLRRLDAARAAPASAVCDPKPFEEDAW